MTTNAALLPTGFCGPVWTWDGLVPAGAARLRLPAQRAALQADAKGSELFDVVEVTTLTESLGRIEELLTSITGRLVDGGVIVLECDNQQSARALRQCVEGRPGAFDPIGSMEDPSQALSLRRLLQAASVAGLWVQDVVTVPATSEDGAQVAKGLFAAGLLPFDWLLGTPPGRYWLVLHKVPQKAGSVLIAGGDAAARQHTLASLRAWLPPAWEVVVGDGVLESSQWNRAVAQARGELVWFLRGGATPTAEVFGALLGPAAIHGGAPGDKKVRQYSGDVTGLMLPRQSVMLAGPVSEHWRNTAVALEEYMLRLDTRLPEAQLVDVAFASPAAPIEVPSVFATESEALLARWAPVQGQIGAQPAAAAGSSIVPPWEGRRPRISLCMIARNEQRFLPQCLQHAKEAVDEIVLVDTGSTDDTVTIAESFGAKVLHTTWTDDFSAPRNLGLQAVTGDWILVLDADEFLRPGACERIRELAEAPDVVGYNLHFINVYGDGKTLGVMMTRLFRNLPGIAYQNVIHEQVTPSLQRIGGPLGLTLRHSDVEVEHHGYTAEVMRQRNKNERNVRLFEKQFQQAPDDIYAHYKYGDFLRHLPGREADARALLDRCFQMILSGPPSLPREVPYAGEVAALCALEAARAGEYELAHEVVDTALRRVLATPNLHYLAATLALVRGQAEDAIMHFRRCLGYHGQVLVVPIEEGITGHVSLCGIAQARLLRGDHEAAERLLQQAITIAPSYESAHLAMSRLWLQRGDVRRALEVLTAFLAEHPDSPGVCQQITLLLQKLGQKDAAARMGRHALAVLQSRHLDRDAAAMQQILAAL